MTGPAVHRLTEGTLATAVKSGDFVSWKASKGTGRGQIVSVHTSSHVPAVPVRIEGTETRPAARIRMYAKNGTGWEPTDTYVALHADRVEPIDPLPAPPAPAPEVVTATEGMTPGSFDDIRQRVRSAIKTYLLTLPGAPAEEYLYVYVEDIGPTWAVVESGGSLWLYAYTIDGNGTVTIDVPTEVYELTTYVSAVQEAEISERDTLTGRLLASAGTTADGARVFDVEIVRFGESKNGRVYPAPVMTAAVPLYEGAKAFDHHRSDEEIRSGSVAGLIGSYHGVRATETGLVGTLRLLPSAGHIGELLDRSLENQQLGLDPLVGISHDVRAACTARIQSGRRIEEATQIVAVASADVVSNPAAGGRVTRMVASAGDPLDPHRTPQPNTLKGTHVNLKQLLEALRTADATQRVVLLRENAHLLTAAGLDEATVVRMAETVTVPAAAAPVPAGTAELVHDKSTRLARMLVAEEVTGAKLDARLVESILDELPARFTEADLGAKVEAYRKVLSVTESTGLRPTVPDARVTSDEQDRKIAALDGFFAGGKGATGPAYRSLKEAYMDITGNRPAAFDSEDFNRRILRESAADMSTMRPFSSADRLTESMTSSSWTYVLGSSITRRMIAEYNQPALSAWERVVSSIIPVNDFREQKIQRVGGYGVLPTVLEGGTYQPLTSPANDTEITYTPSKRGGTEDMTIEMLANDDVRSLSAIPKKLGLAAAQTLYRFVFDIFTANAAINDGVALFHASHSNTTSTALSQAALTASRKAMRAQTAYGDSSNVLSIVPRILLVCSTLEEIAFQLANSAVAIPSTPAGPSNTPNIHAGLEVLVIDYWSTTTGWFLEADPNLVPTIEVGFYQGRREPELFSQTDPTNGSVWAADKLSYKIRHIYGGNVLDYRGLQRGNS